MAIQLLLRVGDSGASDISLTSSGVTLLNYPMNAPTLAQEAIATLGDGQGLSVPAWQNVTETIELHIAGANAAAIQDKIQSIEKLLDLARQGTQGLLADPLYLLVRFDQDTEAWRSQILAARLHVPELTNQIWKNYTKADLMITRRYYFETETLHAITMSSPYTAATTNYVTVYNDENVSLGQEQYVNIAAGEIDGSLPAPVKLHIKNISGGDRQARAFYIGNYVHANPVNVLPVFASEALAGSALSWASDLSHDIAWWSLGSGNLTGSFQGQFGRVVVVWTDRPDPTTLIRASLQLRFPSPVIDLALGEHVPGDTFVTDLGAIPLPPRGIRDAMGANIYITIQGNAATSAGDTVGINWIQVFPTGAGKYRVIRAIVNSWAMESGDELIDDGLNNAPYELQSGNAVPVYRPFYAPLHVWPGVVQRLRILVQGNTMVETAQPWGIKGLYRPRRITA